MGQGRDRRPVWALTAMALALSLAGGAVAAERKAEPRKAVAARAAGAPGKAAAAPRGAAQKPGPGTERAAARKPPETPGAARAPARKEPPPRKPVSKGAPAPAVAVRAAPAARQAGAQGTVVIRGTCTRLVVGGEKYPCKGAIYSLHPDGRVSIQFATHQSTVMLAGGGERETEAHAFGLTVDQVKVAASDGPTRAYAARGHCTVAMKDGAGEVVRTISCDARGGVQADVEFRGDGGKVDAYYLLTNAGPVRGASRGRPARGGFTPEDHPRGFGGLCRVRR